MPEIKIEYNSKCEITKFEFDGRDRTGSRQDWDPTKVASPLKCNIGVLEVYGDSTCVRVGGNLYCW